MLFCPTVHAKSQKLFFGSLNVFPFSWTFSHSQWISRSEGLAEDAVKEVHALVRGFVMENAVEFSMEFHVLFPEQACKCADLIARFSLCFSWQTSGLLGRREKTPTPKTRFSNWTLLDPPCVFYYKNVRSMAVFGP